MVGDARKRALKTRLCLRFMTLSRKTGGGLAVHFGLAVLLSNKPRRQPEGSAHQTSQEAKANSENQPQGSFAAQPKSKTVRHNPAKIWFQPEMIKAASSEGKRWAAFAVDKILNAP